MRSLKHETEHVFILLVLNICDQWYDALLISAAVVIICSKTFPCSQISLLAEWFRVIDRHSNISLTPRTHFGSARML